MKKRKTTKKAEKKTNKKVEKKTTKKVYYTIRQMMRGESITRAEAMKRMNEIKSNVLYNKDLK